MGTDSVVLKFAPLFFFAVTLYGLLNYLTDYEQNMCNMTYMFEYPEYVKIPLNYELMKKFPRYSLYVYGEGRYAQELRSNKLDGIPVLFIPGNAGSYRQIRSVASVSLRMGHSLRSPFHFNFFAASFNEELSGFYGSILEEQAEFIRECTHIIRNMYKDKKKMILLGHSMGGIIARALFSVDHFDNSAISAVITLATPNKEPVIALDSHFISFYEQISSAWTDQQKPGLEEIPVISIGGGQRDFLVRTELTTFSSGQDTSSFHYHVLTTSIPGVWLSVDHLAIVWCKQLVITLSRTLIDLVNSTSKQISSDKAYVSDVLHHHFIQRAYDGHFSKLPYLPVVEFSSSGEWLEETDTSFRFLRGKVLSTVYISVPVCCGENVIVVASGVVKSDWVFGCTLKTMETGMKMCEEGVNLSNKGKIIPRKNSSSERRMVILNSLELQSRDLSHVLIRIEPTNFEVDVLGERYKPSERSKQFSLASTAERIFTLYPVRVMNFLLTDMPVFYSFTVSGVGHIIETATFHLETRMCKSGSVVGHGIINLHIPWSNEDNFYPIKTTLGGVTLVPLKIHLLPQRGTKPEVQLQFILDPECTYILSVTYPISDLITQFIKFYGLYIPSYIVALIMCLLSGQFYAFGSKGTCVSSLYILKKFPTYLSLVVAPSLLHYGIWVFGFGTKMFPMPDEIALEEQSFTYMLVLRSVIYFIAYGTVVSVGYVFEKFVIFLSFMWIWMRKRAVMQATARPLADVQSRLQISYFTVFVCCGLEAMAVGIASSLGITVGFIVYFMKLIAMCVKCRAEEERRGQTAATSKWYFHSVLNLLWICAAVMTVPGTITWVKQLQFSIHLINDPYVLPSATLIMSAAFLWQLPVPCHSRILYRTSSHVIHILASFIALYAVKSTYRILYFVTLTFVLVNIHQVAAFIHGLRMKKTE